MNLPDIVSFGFITLSFVYLVCAIVVLGAGASDTKHRLLFYSFLCFGWWAFAFAIANNAVDVKDVILWRRLAAIGWGLVFSLLLHYTLLLTSSRITKNKSIQYLIIYLPAALNILLYSVLEETSLSVYKMQRNITGWTNIAELTIVNIPHFISNMGFALVMIGLLFNWVIKNKDKVERTAGIIIASTALISIIAGTLTEYVIKTVHDINFPQLGPLSFVVTAIVLFYFSRKGSIMFRISKDMTPAENQIFSNYAQDRIFLQLGLSSTIGGFLVFVDQFFLRHEELFVSVVISSAFLFTAISIFLVTKLKIKSKVKDLIVGLVLSFNLIFLTSFVGQMPISLTLLLHSFYVIMAIILMSTTSTVMIVASVFASLSIAWIRHPVIEVTYTSLDHGIRMAIILVMFSFAIIINYLLKKAIISSQEKVKREAFLSDMANVLMTTDDENFDGKVMTILEMWGRHLFADHVVVIFFDDRNSVIKSKYLWRKTDAFNSSLLDYEKAETWIKDLIKSKYIWDKSNEIGSDESKANANEAVKFVQHALDSGNLMVIALKDADRLFGFVLIEKNLNSFTWQEQEFRTHNVASRMLADAWMRAEAVKKIRYDSIYDKLTDLPNRRYFARRVKQAISMASRTEKLVGICFLDLDSFKFINDTMGHKVGDEFLKQIGYRLKESIRGYDLAARFGGDEFLIMLQQVDDISYIEKAVIRILDNIKIPVMINEQSLAVSASMGVSVYPFDGDNYNELLKNADIALYASKESGKGKYVICSEVIKKEANLHNALTNDLNTALEKNEMILHYQPVVHTPSERIVEVEALLRWKHPRFGMVSPQIFIPLAEKSGLMNKIGTWVINQACLQSKKWQDLGLEPIAVAVNISITQFLDENLVDIVKEALEKACLAPNLLELEITESISIHCSTNIAEKIDRLKELGVKVAIDDFGTGFSSFSRLNSMNVDKIKIDMQFIHGISRNKTDEEIIKAITQLGKTLNIKVLAEGVEEQTQLSFLKENLCDEIQGYYFFKPMDADLVENILRKQAELAVG